MTKFLTNWSKTRYISNFWHAYFKYLIRNVISMIVYFCWFLKNIYLFLAFRGFGPRMQINKTFIFRSQGSWRKWMGKRKQVFFFKINIVWDFWKIKVFFIYLFLKFDVFEFFSWKNTWKNIFFMNPETEIWMFYLFEFWG